VNTNLVFDKFADCLAAEEQMRKHYIDAFDAWDRGPAINIPQRRQYVRERDLQAKRLAELDGRFSTPVSPLISFLGDWLGFSSTAPRASQMLHRQGPTWRGNPKKPVDRFKGAPDSKHD
jgi:hypothetical protein